MPLEKDGVFYPFKEMAPVQDLMDRIMQATDLQINEFICAIMRRYQHLYPDWEIMMIALPTDPALRKDAVENAVQFILNHSNISAQ